MIVMKFGGTSVADEAAIERLMAIVRAARQVAIQPESQDWRGPIVVVSALGGATDKFLALGSDAAAGKTDAGQGQVEALRRRHLDLARVIGNSPERPQGGGFLNKEVDELDRVARALC